MNDIQKRNLELLNSIKDGFTFSEEECEEIIKNSSEILMSKTNNTSLYGMFLPCEQLQKIFIYKGKLVKDAAKCDFTYYFDKDKRLVLTRRQFPGGKLTWIFYYYYDSYIDIIWYDTKDKKILIVGRIEMPDGVLTRWIEGRTLYKDDVQSYDEYLFTVKQGWVCHRMFSIDFEKFLDRHPEFKKRVKDEKYFTVCEGA